MKPLSCLMRLGLSILTAAFIYINCAVIDQPMTTRWGTPKLPISNSLYDAWLIFGVFSYYETNNHELMLWGYTGDPSVGTKGWKRMPQVDYFPFSLGERDGRLWASKHYRLLDRNQHWRAWLWYGDQILARHNRLQPEAPLYRIGIESWTWPRSPQGFYALMTPTNTQYQFWVVATNR
ncbi:MAG: hypothetical protein HY043_20775 [Verrucomicrobia bacterium]|nr:hypothetical protein [Verrucomicrobiota bacterium]